MGRPLLGPSVVMLYDDRLSCFLPGLIVRVPELVRLYVGVDLRGGKVSMSQKLLKLANVHPALEKVRCRRMTK